MVRHFNAAIFSLVAASRSATLNSSSKAASRWAELPAGGADAAWFHSGPKFGEQYRRRGRGARVMHAEERPAFLAKNRYGLPDTLPLSWSEFLAAMPQSA